MYNLSYAAIAKNFYSKWNNCQRSVNGLTGIQRYIISEICKDAFEGAKFRRFYYNELNTLNITNITINSYEVEVILKNEEFNIIYENDSFVVRWVEEVIPNSTTTIKELT